MPISTQEPVELADIKDTGFNYNKLQAAACMAASAAVSIALIVWLVKALLR